MLLRIFLITVLILIVLKLTLWLINYVRLSQGSLQDDGGAAQINKMVKDPVCGVYVAVSEAVSVPTKHGNLYFCSNECREKFLRTQK